MTVNVEGTVIAATLGVLIHVLLALLFLFSTVANVLVIIIFYRRPALRTLSNRFVVSLLVFNLVATGLLLPMVLMDSIMDLSVQWQSQLETTLCAIGQALTTLVTTGSISAALVIAVDQYCAVMTPLHYHRRVTKARAWLLLAAQWLLAVAMAVFSIVDSSGKQFWKGCLSALPRRLVSGLPPPPVTDDQPLAFHLSSSDTTQLANTSVVGLKMSDSGERLLRDVIESEQAWTTLFVACSVLCYVVPVALLSWMYLRIYSAAHRNSQRTRRASLTHSASELVVHCLGSSQTISGSMAQVNAQGSGAIFSSQTNQTWAGLGGGGSFGVRGGDPPSRTPSLRSTSSQIVHNLRYRISNASLFLYREESRAARVSVFVLVLVVFCWLPYHVVLVLHALPERRLRRLPSYAYHLTLVAILLNALFSPFLYAYRSRRIQREVRRLFGLSPKSRRKDLLSSSLSSKRSSGGQGQAKSLLRPVSPRRHLMNKQVRDSDALTADEVQSVLNKTSATPIPTSPTRMRSFMHKVTRLWRKPSPPATLSAVADDCEAAAPSSTAELTVVDVSRSSFSSGTSSNSCSADSDVSL